MKGGIQAVALFCALSGAAAAPEKVEVRAAATRTTAFELWPLRGPVLRLSTCVSRTAQFPEDHRDTCHHVRTSHSSILPRFVVTDSMHSRL